MPNDLPVFNTLMSSETGLVRIMRRFMDNGLAHEETDDGDPIYARVEVPLLRFIDLLWRTDPYAVSLYHRLDYDVSIFELQVLYVIAEKRAGNFETVDELLGWWFPAALVPEAHATLNIVTKILEEEQMPRASGARDAA